MSKAYDVWHHTACHDDQPSATQHKPRTPNCLGGVCDKLRTVLTSLCWESTVVTLTLLSVLAITGEILTEYGILTAPPDNEDHQTSTNGENAQQSQGESSDTSSTESEREALEAVQKVFHYISLTIAAGFFLEMMVKIAVFRRKFFMQPWQVVDLVIVCASLAVEVTFEVNGRQAELEICTIIVLVRLWRIPHACDIRAQRVQQDLDQEIEVWKAGASKMQDRCNNLDLKNTKQKEKIERLERELAALKKGTKEHRQENLASVPNGVFLGNHHHHHQGNVQSPNHLAVYQSRILRKENIQPGRDPRTLADSEDDDTTDGSPGRRTNNSNNRSREEEERDTEEDTMEEDEEGDEERQCRRRRNYFRSGSESSLSCYANEQEVRVQIEDEATVTSSTEKEGAALAGENSTVVVQIRRKKVNSGGESADGAEAPTSRQVCYQNEAFVPDLEEGQEEFRGELLQEFDGARTYRSADGIPMTDL